MGAYVCKYNRQNLFTSDMATSENTPRQRIVYIITYSRAASDRFPNRHSFAEAVLKAWKNSGLRIIHWVVSQEAHAETDPHAVGLNPYHFHMAVKLSKRGRWFRVRKFLEDEYGIQVNFSGNHNTYYSAYKYVTKEDAEALHSPRHPDLLFPLPQRLKLPLRQGRGKRREQQGNEIARLPSCPSPFTMYPSSFN